MKELLRSSVAWLVSRLPAGIFTDKRFFELYQRRGWHATPVHFSQPVPDTSALPSDLWERRSEMIGIDLRLDRQAELLREFSERYLPEYHQIPDSLSPTNHAYHLGTPFSGIDGGVLYSMIRKHRPRRMIEVGAGMSTLLSALALRRNAEDAAEATTEFVVIDPHPRDYLLDEVPGLTRLVVEKAENVPLSEFTSLGENDILFIDSSHVVQIGNEVVYAVLEILPRLRPGVIIHFHDIFMPYEYPQEWVLDRHRFWNEQYLLQAFLAFNDRFEILWSSASMHADHPELLKRGFAHFDPAKKDAASLWIRKLG